MDQEQLPPLGPLKTTGVLLITLLIFVGFCIVTFSYETWWYPDIKEEMVTFGIAIMGLGVLCIYLWLGVSSFKAQRESRKPEFTPVSPVKCVAILAIYFLIAGGVVSISAAADYRIRTEAVQDDLLLYGLISVVLGLASAVIWGIVGSFKHPQKQECAQEL